jgi:hypothetical protein
VYFFFKMIGNGKVAAGLFCMLCLFSVMPRYSPAVTFDGSLSWWDWSVFGLGAAFFLSLGAMLMLRLFEADIIRCGEPGVLPAWADMFGLSLPASAAPDIPASVGFHAPPRPNLKIPFLCRSCGADTEVPYSSSTCPFCGELPSSDGRKRSVFRRTEADAAD